MFIFAVMFVFNKLTVWRFEVALQLLVANRLERLMCEDNFGREIIRCEVEFLGGVFFREGATAYLMWAAYHASLPDS